MQPGEVAPAQPDIAMQPLQPVQGGVPTAPVESDNLAPVGSGAGGFAGEMWRGTEASAVQALFERMTVPPRSPVLSGLWRRLLLSDAPEPAGSSARPVLALRAERLMRHGWLKEASDLSASVANPSDPALRMLGARADLAAGNSDRACQTVRDALPQASGMPEAMRKDLLLITAYCSARTKSADAAGLAGDLLRDQGVDDPLAIAVLDSIAETKTPKVPRPEHLDMIDYLFLSLVGSASAEDALATASPALLMVLAADGSAQPQVRLAAAERAAALNALDAGALADAYASVAFPPERIASPLASLEDGPVGRALLFQAVTSERDPGRKARYARALLVSARDDDVADAVAQALADPIADLPQTPELAWFAETAIEIDLAAGRYGPAVSWTLFGDKAASGGTSGLITWLALADVADPEAHVARGSSLDPLGTAAAAGAFPPDQLHRIITVLDALEYSIPIPLWDLASRTPQPSAGYLPATGVLADLQAAAKAHQAGRTVLLAIEAIGGGKADEANLLALGDAIRALKAVGFETEARRLGYEALAADWPRHAAQ